MIPSSHTMDAAGEETGHSAASRKATGGDATLSDVARSAGVSLATASTVLNRPRSNTRVSAATRERILIAARELRYHPNAHARSLLGRKSGMIGVVFGLERARVAVANPYAFAVFQGIVAGAAEAGQNVALYTEPWHNVERSAGPFRDKRTDGIIVIAPATDSDIIPGLTDLGIPLVAVATPADEGIVPSVDVDNAVGARLATGRLLELGHTRIAHLSGDEILLISRQRRQAFQEAMARAGVEVLTEYALPGDYTAKSGYERALQLLDLPEPPTAIFAANDDIALGILEAAEEKGVPVPAALSIVGFDGIPRFTPNRPALTTIRQPLEEIGKEAAHLLLKRIEGEEVPAYPHLFLPVLVEGDTTAHR